jgi:hypothetical protein
MKLAFGRVVELPLNRALIRAGQYFNADWLIFNPLEMRRYDRYARQDASAIVTSFESVFPEAETYVDVGCACGAIAIETERRGHRAVGCERSLVGRLIARHRGLDCRPFDLTHSPPAALDGPYDLAFCLEVAQHLPEQFGRHLVAYLAELADTVVFSSARPGQGAVKNVNPQSREYWDQAFDRAGMHLDRHSSEALRDLFIQHGVDHQWYINNVTVYRRLSASATGARR